MKNLASRDALIEAVLGSKLMNYQIHLTLQNRKHLKSLKKIILYSFRFEMDPTMEEKSDADTLMNSKGK